jgi:hypothetical protein
MHLSFQQHDFHVQNIDLWMMETHAAGRITFKGNCLLLDWECCYLLIICPFHQPQHTKEPYFADVHGDEQVRARLGQSFMSDTQAM